MRKLVRQEETRRIERERIENQHTTEVVINTHPTHESRLVIRAPTHESPRFVRAGKKFLFVVQYQYWYQYLALLESSKEEAVMMMMTMMMSSITITILIITLIETKKDTFRFRNLFALD